METTPACVESHMGPWCIQPATLASGLSMLRSGMVRPTMVGAHVVSDGYAASGAEYPFDGLSGGISGGTMTIPVVGLMTRGVSKFGGTSTILAIRKIREAMRDDDVERIQLYIDSPGGTYAGTPQLANAIREASAVKPVHAHIENGGYSAAVWVASQAQRVTMSAESFTGSVGVITYLYDTSERFEIEGVKAVVISTSPLKATGIDGVPISEAQIEHVRETIETMAGHFFDAVKSRQKIDETSMEKIMTGREFNAAEALRLGLVDSIETWADAYHGGSQMPEEQPLTEKTFLQAMRGLFASSGPVDGIVTPQETPQQAHSRGYQEGLSAGTQQAAQVKAEFDAYKAQVEKIIEVCQVGERPDLIFRAMKEDWSAENTRIAVSIYNERTDDAHAVSGVPPESSPYGGRHETPSLSQEQLNKIYERENNPGR